MKDFQSSLDIDTAQYLRSGSSVWLECPDFRREGPSSRRYIRVKSKKRIGSLDTDKSIEVRSGSSVWLECRPVTPEVASSSLVRTATHSKKPLKFKGFFDGRVIPLKRLCLLRFKIFFEPHACP